MKNIFLAALAALIVFSQCMLMQGKGTKGSLHIPKLYWLGLPNPERAKQIEDYRQWLSKHHLGDVDIHVDSMNQGLSKVMIQSVSGVAGDLPEFYSGTLPFFAEMGILAPIEPLLAKSPFKLPQFFDAVSNDIYFNGKLYGWPNNVSLFMLVMNKDLFKEMGLASPPWRWDLDTFEKYGRSFNNKKISQKGSKTPHFFAEAVPLTQLRMNSGISLFNETLTASAVNQPRYHLLLKRVKKWIYEEHFFPTAAERSSFTAEAGSFNGSSFQLFTKGYYGLIWSGRHTVVALRAMGYKGSLSAIPAPHDGYPVHRVMSRITGIYSRSPHPSEGLSFLAYFSSPEHNENLVQTGDALPPTPGYTASRQFTHPDGRENEWGLHQAFAQALEERLVGSEITPFLPKTIIYSSIEDKKLSGVLSGVQTAEEAAAEAQAVVDSEIERYVKTRPDLQLKYLEAKERQRKIESLKSEGKKIPLQWVDNPFLKGYYEFSGQGE